LPDGPIKFIKQKGDNFTFNGLDDLKGKTIALVRDYGYGDSFLKSKSYKPFIVTDFLQAAEMLAKNRVDLTLENELVARTRIHKEAIRLEHQLEYVDTPLSNNYIFVVSSYKNPRHAEYIQAFNTGLEIILKNGRYQKILEENNLLVPSMFQAN